MHSGGRKHRQSDLTWNTQLIKHITAYGKGIWRDRCEILHKLELSKRLEKQLKECESRIENEFAVGIEGLRAGDCRIIENIDKDEVLNKPLCGQLQWLRHVEVARDRYAAVYEDSYDGMREIFRRWLGGLEDDS